MCRVLVTGAALLGMAFWSITLHAAEPRAVVSPLATLSKLAVALIVVLAVFWLFAKVMRHLQTSQTGLQNGLRVVSALSLGQRERVVVVQAGDEQLVLGVTGTHINKLHTMSKPLTSPENTEVNDFRQKLRSAVKRQATQA